MGNEVKISVVVPLYNKSDYIKRTLDSVFCQTFKAYEIIVVDDGSTDGSSGLVHSLYGDQVKLIFQRNSGVSAARNKGISEASGDFIAFLDADDTFKQGYLEEMHNLILMHPGQSFFGTAYEVVDELGEFLRSSNRVARSYADNSIISDFYSIWSQGAFIFTSSIVIRRAAFFDNDIFFPVGENMGEDQDVWMRISEKYPLVYSNKALSNYYRVQDSLTMTNRVHKDLPCFIRLRKRVDSGECPHHMKRSALRLLATNRLNLANAHFIDGSFLEGWKVLLSEKIMHHPLYWVKTLVLSFVFSVKRLKSCSL